MGDSVAPACVNVVPDAADPAFQIHRMKRSAYSAVLGSFCAQSDLLSGAKEECLAQLRKELKILETEHRDYLVEARSNKQMNYLSARMSKGSTCNNEVTKDTPHLTSTMTDGDAVFQIHCLERSAYASVLRVFGAVTNHLSWLQVKLLDKLRNELRVSHIEHKEVLAKVISNEHIKSLRKFSLANYPVLMKMDAAFHAQAAVNDKIASTEQISTSSTSWHSLAQQSPIPERSMPSIRNNAVLESSSGAHEGSYFEPHVAKRLKSVCELALAYLERPPSAEQLPMESCTVIVKSCTDDTIDRETLPCEVKDGCTIYPIFQKKHIQSNAGQDPSCADDHGRQESRKRNTEVPEMRGSKSLCVTDITHGISYEKHMNKDQNWEQDSEIFKIRLTANLLNKVEKLFKDNPDPIKLDTAKSMLKDQEKDLLDALAKLFELSKNEADFSTNCHLAKVNNHDALPPRSVSSTDKTPPETTISSPSANSTVTLQVPRQTGTFPHAAVLTQPSSMEMQGSLTVAPASEPRNKRSRAKFTAEQKERMQEFVHRVGWAAQRTDSTAVDALCAQLGISRFAFLQWTYRQKRRANAPRRQQKPSVRKCYYTAEQKQQRLELAHRLGWAAPKTPDDSAAVEAFCAQVGISRGTLVRWMYNHKYRKTVRTGVTPPPPPAAAAAAAAHE